MGMCCVCVQVVKVFDNLMEEISGQVSGLSSQNPELTATLRNSLQVNKNKIKTTCGVDSW